MTETRKPALVDRLEGTPEGRLELAAARAAVSSVQLINRALQAADLSQRELARRIGVTEGRVSQVLNGDGNLRVSTLARFLRACGYRLQVSAVPVEVSAPQLASPGRRERQVRPGPRYAAVRTVACVTEDGVTEEPVIQLSRSHPKTFFGDVYDAVVDLETGEVEHVRTVRESVPTGRRPAAAKRESARV